ncbi:TetR/AcrR family transcriptional regulator [Pseudonocardia sp. RS11V-5]|uniref:TetR/AcrR family transcriptional regulator n=1 Tax=Pseudonocardia terrae TaxID=2905831 RepID=UPI001E3C290A|nr:TetR/AcrR family transcriptional regulator [Pseudonocardia terrae]MCE3550875.1 TetR/AcrR family transcriptional regulator [Pseudonocardia terrae]
MSEAGHIAHDVPEARRPVAPKARPQEVNESRYEHIVDVAAELFRRKGYAATSINDIAEAAGLMKGSLYHYINSKEDLLSAIVDQAHHNTASLGEELLAADATAEDKLRFVVRRHLRGTEQNQTKIQVLYREFPVLPAERFAEVIRRRDTYERAVRELVRQGQREGTFAPTLNPWLTAASILATLNSVQAWFTPDGPMSMTEIIDGYTALLLRSVGVETENGPAGPAGKTSAEDAGEPG